LLIGDSVSIYYTAPTRKILHGYANVHHIPQNGGSTEYGLKHLQEWLRNGKWDVIYFNWGLSDLVAGPASQHSVPLDQYQKNLAELVRQLKLTGAALVWGTTTPDPQQITEKGSPYNDSDIVAYNAAAQKVMDENHIYIDNLWSYGPSSFRGSRRLSDAEFKDACYDLGDQAASYVLLAEAFTPVKEDPHLPRVLLIGDSVSYYYTYPARLLLKGKANVYRIGTNGGNTDDGLKTLQEWLGTGKWDVIHFNFGLHDFVLDEHRQHEVPLERYKQNLRKLVQRMKATGATLVWASTTPIPPGPTRNYISGSDAEYNAAALEIMNENHILVDDLYGFSMPRLSEVQRPLDVHPRAVGGEAMATQVADSIIAALSSK
jgi:acyl-CoA thioesterase-1